MSAAKPKVRLIRWLPPAENSLLGIVDFIAEDKPEAAAIFVGQLRAAVASPNTRHLTILTTGSKLICGSECACRRRSGQLLILRLTPRTLRRPQRSASRSLKSSLITPS